MDFLGNKRSLLPLLLNIFQEHSGSQSTFIDLFSGTGTVSAAVADIGYKVHANDQLPLAVMWSMAQLSVRTEPTFDGLRSAGIEISNVQSAIEHLNALSGVPGWVTTNYTPLSSQSTPFERKYFTEANGMRIDAIRNEINSWRPMLSGSEWALLMTSLTTGVSSVSNIAGTYGCYLKQWKPRALTSIKLKAFGYKIRAGSEHLVSSRDAQLVAEETSAEIAYADPPYTKRQYAAYYHLLNSVIQKSDPVVSGKTGLPAWRVWSSDWCYSRKAPRALDQLAAKNSSRKFVLSYSSDGHISHNEILEILGQYGKTQYYEAEKKRFRSSTREHASHIVSERVYVMSR
ncbi:DNA adenine methylase [Arthrobacter sp. StoSoilB22]|uniref:DNA adenine methylase n=1 Tax=Arthrobacter sp. StoSoilB22 TaxID=2830996 RepID=UPI001CC722A8|nr:DNA adenine methylase [Arthrobacter sp. StoSoilB22]BCW62174.1 restriction endonuclease subunit M [Arthrobacter sp. StoSoilB22]